MNKISKSAFMGYVPVVSKNSYEMLEEYGNSVEEIFIIDGSELPLRAIQKDYRALSAKRIVELFKPIIPAIIDVSLEDVGKYTNGKMQLFMPHDEVSEFLLKNKFIDKNTSIFLDNRFYRWHQKNITKPDSSSYDYSLDISEIKKDIIEALITFKEKSNDWWRNVSAVLTNSDQTILLSSNNMYVPNFYSAEISGDMRSNFSKGNNIDLANAIHAEANLIAKAASDGLRIGGLDLHVSTFPCPTCAKLISASKIQNLYYYDGYSISDGYNILKSANVNVVKVVND